MEGQLYHHHHHEHENSFGVVTTKQHNSINYAIINHHPFGVGVKKFNSFNGVLDMDHVLDKACLILENLVRANSELMQNASNSVASKQLTRFHSRTIPDISIRKYLLRIVRYSPHPAECIVTGLVYLDKVIRKHALVVSMFNVHRLLITAFVLSVKYHCDQIYTNKHYAKVGGVQAKELAKLEFDFLRMLNYDIIVSKRELDHYTEKLFNIGSASSNEVEKQGHVDVFRGRTGSDVTMESVKMAHQKSSRSYSISAAPIWQKKEITGEEVP
jgi:hypothetical protein